MFDIGSTYERIFLVYLVLSNLLIDSDMKQEYLTISLKDLMDSPFQGRFSSGAGENVSPSEKRSFDELRESIGRSGLLNPLIARRKDDRIEIIDGHRRAAACRELGWQEISVLLVDADDKQAQAMSIIGNLQRKDLNNIELAMAYGKILDSGLYADKKELSVALGKDETYVGDLLNTLKMDSRIVDDLVKNNSVRDLKLLRAIRKSAPADSNQRSDYQWNIYNRVISEGLSRADLKAILQKPAPRGIKPWKTRTNPGSMNVRISTLKMSQTQRETLLKLVDEKLAEVFERLYKS